MIRQWRDIGLRVLTASRAGAVVLIASYWLIAGEPNPKQVREKKAQAQVQLPEGEGKEIVSQKCVKCHTLDKVTKEHRTDSEWRDLLKIMVVQGLELTREEDETVFKYLTTNLGKAQTPNIAKVASAESGGREITYSKDVAPIFYKHCVACHHPNDIAPMSLMSYNEVRPWATSIREKVAQRAMPPWHADSKVGEFSNDQRLTEAEIGTIRAWVSGGAKEGDPKDLPPAPEFQEGWHIKPDVVFSVPEHVASANNQDDLRYYYIPTNFTEDKWVQAAEVLPSEHRVVHHAGVLVISADDALNHREDTSTITPSQSKFYYKTGTALHIKPEMPVVDDGCASPTGGEVSPKVLDWDQEKATQLAIYLPGHGAEVRPEGYAVKIPKGSYLQFDVHYSNRLGEDLKDHTSIGLVFAKEPAKHEVEEYEMWNELFLIPPNADNHRVTRCTTVPRDVIALAYTAHMHFRGKSMTTEAIYPDGLREVIMNVPHYDFRWQETYFLKEPKFLPKGTRLEMTGYFDNSANNPLNPDPLKAVRYGEPSNEEMIGFWLQFALAHPIDVKVAAAEAKDQ